MAMLCYIALFTLVTGHHIINGQLVIQDIRLANNGNNDTFGRVEIQVNGLWGTVCDDKWDNLAASVVCRTLNFLDGGVGTSKAQFGQGTGTIFLDEVTCAGDENGLAECKMSPSIGATDCTHAEDAGVICRPNNGQPVPVPTTTQRPIGPQPDNCDRLSRDVRLIAPSGIQGIGLVEVFSQGVWGSVCDDMFDEVNARVVCAMLCYDTTFARPGAPDEIIKDINASAIVLDSINCNGNEARIQDCPDSPWSNTVCGPKEVASVTCVNLNSRAPDAPVPILRCTKGYLIALFNRSRDRFLEEKHLTIPGATGACNVLKSTDDDFVSIRIPFQECGTKVNVNATHLIYSNLIKYASTNYDGNKIRVNSFPVSVFCEMLRAVDADRNLVPLTESVTKRAEGRFVINMTFYQNNSFTIPVSQYPVRMPLGEWLNVALQLESIDSRLKLIVPDCVATPSADRQDIVRYPLFEDNCPIEPTLGFSPLSQIKFGYRYQPFMFVNNPMVYIHCGAFVCLVDETGAECDRSCETTKPNSTTGRRKRDLHSLETREKYYINSGPMMVYKPNNVDTIIERIDEAKTVSTTISIPLPTEIQEKLTKSTAKPKPAANGATAKVRATSKKKPSTQPSRPDSISEAPTTPMPQIERVVTQKSPTTTPLEGTWIEYPRRSDVSKSESVNAEKGDTFQSRLRYGINNASSAKQTFTLLTLCVFLFLLVR